MGGMELFFLGALLVVGFCVVDIFALLGSLWAAGCCCGEVDTGWGTSSWPLTSRNDVLDFPSWQGVHKSKARDSKGADTWTTFSTTRSTGTGTGRSTIFSTG